MSKAKSCLSSHYLQLYHCGKCHKDLRSGIILDLTSLSLSTLQFSLHNTSSQLKLITASLTISLLASHSILFSGFDKYHLALLLACQLQSQFSQLIVLTVPFFSLYSVTTNISCSECFQGFVTDLSSLIYCIFTFKGHTHVNNLTSGFPLHTPPKHTSFNYPFIPAARLLATEHENPACLLGLFCRLKCGTIFSTLSYKPCDTRLAKPKAVMRIINELYECFSRPVTV